MKERRLFLLLAAIVAALGGLLFGFDTAVISGTTPFLQPYFRLSDVELGWTVSSLLLGCIAGVICSGKPGDALGRRNTLLIAAVMFMVSAAGSALSTRLAVFIGFRFLGGVAVGTASMLSPMYISEISPAARRGTLVSLNQLAIVVGILIAFFSNYLLAATGENNWRWMLGVMGIPALFFFVTLLFVPESPRWLAQKGRKDTAYRILERINGTEVARGEMAAIETSMANRSEGSYHEVFSPKMSRILWTGVVLSIFSQVTGINSIMYYAPIIFKSIGSGTDSALIQTSLIGGVNLVFTLVALRWIDRWGRKPLLIAGTIGMGLSLGVIALAFHLRIFEGYLILAFILIYIASFAASLGPVTWVVIAEIYPNRLRSKAMSVAIVAIWASCFLVSLAFPVILNRFGGAAAFSIFGAMCILLLAFVLLRIPETRGRSLEELEQILLQPRR